MAGCMMAVSLGASLFESLGCFDVRCDSDSSPLRGLENITDIASGRKLEECVSDNVNAVVLHHRDQVALPVIAHLPPSFISSASAHALYAASRSAPESPTSRAPWIQDCKSPAYCTFAALHAATQINPTTPLNTSIINLICSNPPTFHQVPDLEKLPTR